jgi:hypothetical protein
MKLVQMKALLLGTVVGDHWNSLGEITNNSIVHVDPNNKLEEGRYTDPIVTQDVAKKLEDAGFAKRVKDVRFEKGIVYMDGAPGNADEAAERLAQFREADTDHQQPAALDSRETVNFPDRAAVSGGAGGGEDTLLNDVDAAPVPRAPNFSGRPAPTSNPGDAERRAAAATKATPKPTAKKAPARKAAAKAAPKPAPTPAPAPAPAPDTGGN